MITNHIARLVFIFVVIAGSASTAMAWPHKNGQKAHVRFLATSTLIRGTWGQDEDTYLAELTLAHGAEGLLVRLIDTYPNEAPPLSRVVLTVPSGIILQVRRDMNCDRPFAQMVLRTAPGDPMAILPERLGYQPPLGRTPKADTNLPCYRITRR